MNNRGAFYLGVVVLATVGLCGCGKPKTEFSVRKAPARSSLTLSQIRSGTWSGTTKAGDEVLTVTFKVHPEKRAVTDIVVDWGSMYVKTERATIKDDLSFEVEDGYGLKGRFLSEAYAEGTAEPTAIVRTDGKMVKDWRVAPK